MFGHRVLVAPQENAAQAQILAQRLNKAGIDDLLVYRSGEYANGISLGVFANRSNAERVSVRARRLGIATELVPVLKPVDSHFVSIRRDADTVIDLSPIREALKIESLPVNEVDCRTI